MNEKITYHGDSGWTIGDLPLVFYHFHGLRRIFWRFVRKGAGEYGPSWKNQNLLYAQYLERLRGQESNWDQIGVDRRFGMGAIRWFFNALRRKDLMLQ